MPVRNSGFEPQIIADFRPDSRDGAGQTYVISRFSVFLASYLGTVVSVAWHPQTNIVRDI
jgi:hypothetical protein